MNTVFVGGSRQISRLPKEAKERLNNIISNGFNVIVGDANGADKAVQGYLLESAYKKVVVFCSGDRCRNNLGHWPTQNVQAPKSAKGFQFYAVKDREMAREADFGLMIWEGKSAGTILNVLRLVRAGKKVVLLDGKENNSTTFRSAADWNAFLMRCDMEFRNGLRKRATPEEWQLTKQPRQTSFFDPLDTASISPGHTKGHEQANGEVITDINAALSSGSLKVFIDVLGGLARNRSMSQIAKQTGLARESLYRALSEDGNPKFTTVLKVIDAVGLRLKVEKADTRPPEGAD